MVILKVCIRILSPYSLYIMAIPHAGVLATLSECAFAKHKYRQGQNNPSKDSPECSYEM